MAKEAKCRACGEMFEKPAPASRYCLREACMAEREAKKPAAPKKAQKKAEPAAPKRSKASDAGSKPDPRVTGALEAIGEQIRAHELQINNLCRAGNTLAAALGLEEPFVEIEID